MAIIKSILKKPSTTGRKKTKKAMKKKTSNNPRSNNKSRKMSPEAKLYKLPKAECLNPNVKFNLGYKNIAFEPPDKVLDKSLLRLSAAGANIIHKFLSKYIKASNKTKDYPGILVARLNKIVIYNCATILPNDAIQAQP